ncbi:MAG: hypothetical protein N3E51_00650 [Candidatus Micrarchaeota archaeon]|nr:hypothetical protein [Candidatus Micrarchaeota archaeon]
MEATPAISAPQVICAGTPIQLTLNVNSGWRYSTFEGGTASGAINQGELISNYNQASGVYPIKWSTKTVQSGLRSYQQYFEWHPTNTWEGMLNSWGLGDYPQSTEKEVGIRYQLPNNQPGYFNGKYRAYVGMICAGTASIVVDGNSISSEEYLGSSITKTHTFSAGQHSLGATLYIDDCAVPIRNILSNPERIFNVWTTIDYNFHPTFTATNQNIFVLENFLCGELPISNQWVSNPNPAPSAQVSFRFDLSNPFARDIRINSISLSPQSSPGFTNFNAGPANTVIPPGQSRQFTGSVNVPPSPGSKTMYVDVSFDPVNTQCAQTGCASNARFVFTINIPAPSQKPDYIPLISTTTAYVGEQFTATIITRNQGNRDCENQTQTNYEFNGANQGFFSVRPLAAGGDQQADSRNFTCPSIQGSYPLAATADATFKCDESNESNNYLQVQVNCIPRPLLPPVSCTLSPNPGGTFVLGASGTFTAACRDINNAPTYCPQLSWTSTRGTMSPQTTQNGTSNPQSVFTAASVGAGEVRATAANFFCASPISVISSFANLTLACSLVGHSPYFFPGESAQVRADCLGSGETCPALSWSTTIIQASMNPQTTLPGPSPRFSLFSIAPSAPTPQAGTIRVQCANPEECSATCDVNVNLYPVPNRLVCSLENRTQVPPNLFSANDWSWVRGRCYSFDSETACPNLTWFTRDQPIPNSYFEPNPTPQQVGPLTNFSTRDVPPPFPRYGFIDARSANPAIPAIACEAAINISVVPVIGPNYQIVLLKPSKVLALQGERVKISIWTRNVGNLRAQGQSLTLTRVLPEDCLPDRYVVPPLMPGETDTHSRYDYECPCTTVGLHRIVAEANADRAISETDYSDNNRTAVFYCGSNYTLICPDYV